MAQYRWVVRHTNGRCLSHSTTNKYTGAVRNGWTKDPSKILYHKEKPSTKPVNSTFVKVKVDHYFYVSPLGEIPEVVKTDLQMFATEYEYHSYEDALKEAQEKVKEKLQKYNDEVASYQEKINLLTQWLEDNN